MADAAVNFALTTLGSLLIQQIELLGSAEKEVRSIKSELESIRSFLKDTEAIAAAEEKGANNEDVSTWVKQLRDEAYRIEDVIDEFSSTMAQLPDVSGFLCLFHKISRFVKKLKLQHKIANEIRDIKSSIDDAHQRAQRYNDRSIDQGSNSGTRNVVPHDSRVGPFSIEDTEALYIDDSDKLIRWLKNGRPELSVIAVVGEGGLGKTTLATKIYEDHAVKLHFDCQAWINVRKDSSKKDLLRTIIREFNCQTQGKIEEMDENQLNTTLRNHVEENSYMVVFDDVREIKFWEDNVKGALLDNKKNSRIMLTTRNKRVAEFVPSSEVHKLAYLPFDEQWKLFCKKAFAPDGCCPPELRDLSEGIVKKCGKLPLAITAVGGLLSTKNKTYLEWKKLHDGLGSKLGRDPHLRSCNIVLSEGYYDLPYYLKSCLLYFGLFPEKYSVSCQTLMRLWIAEGFVQYIQNVSFEQVAEEYLDELIDRSLVHVVSRDISGRARSCKVHDLMYEFILRKTEELGFCRILKEEDSNPDGDLPDSFMTTLAADFKLIKVLDLRNSPIRYLPKGVGNLFHLHYLNVRNTEVDVLPKSIGKLVNLETLDLKLTLVTELPVEMKNLEKLRYLRVSNLHSVIRGIKLPAGFGTLKDLWKLYFVQADTEVLKEMRKLRKLGIILTNGNGKNLCASIGNMETLESLVVDSISREEIIDIQSISSRLQCLQRLNLMGTMNKLPDWIINHPSLIRVDLNLSGLREDPIRVLQSLPNLLELRLKDTYHYEQLQLKEGWFPNLLELTLSHFKKLKLMIVDKGTMPCLKHLKIVSCPLLKDIPTEHLKDVKIENNDVSLLSSTAKYVMGQKIVLKVHIHCDKCKFKAMKICSSPKGVTSVGYDKSKHQITVTGNGIDPTNLVSATRKKLGYAELISVGMNYT